MKASRPCPDRGRGPVEQFSGLAAFDGSVIVERTAGEVSAQCHEEQAHFLALNLMHDIVTGTKSVRCDTT